jgi:5-(carboxyamino)imidazole ribonucleotide synthase
MLALAGYPLGLQFRFYDSSEGPASHLAHTQVGAFDDLEALERFAEGLDLVTYEFENVPVEAARFLAELLPVYPPPRALEVSQDRLSEKQFVQQLGIPTAPFYPVQSHADLLEGLGQLGYPAVLKTRRLGYDGKGQSVVHNPEQAHETWAELDEQPLILEGFINFERELSLLAVRNPDGQTAFYPLVQNTHRQGILYQSLAPAPNIADLQPLAEEYAKRMLLELNYVGVLAIEFFGDDLRVNEIAPRVHNSGHWSIEGAFCSQFTNHLRAMLNWPLGLSAPKGFSVMRNLIGHLPDPAQLSPDFYLHLYGKGPRPGRKLGHITATADSPSGLEALLSGLDETADPK